MRILGLTGGLSTGKSTVAAMFAKRGAAVIDADAITRDLLKPKTKCSKKVAKIFGHGILTNGLIDRRLLSHRVFQNPRELKKLTDILYPEALKEVKKQIIRYKNKPLIVLDVPLLFESGWYTLTTTTCVVKASRLLQWQRAKRHLHLTHAEFKQRVALQMPMREKIKRADIVVDNSKGIVDTDKQVEVIYRRLIQRKD